MSCRCVLIGAVAFSRAYLDALCAAGLPPCGVLTLDPSLRHRHSDYCDLAAEARARGIDSGYISNSNAPETIRRIRDWSPDYLLVFGWSQLIGSELMAVPRHGCLGVHPALLPRHRGRHPLIWPLVNGETEGGLSFFFLAAEADAGDLIVQQAFPITPDDTAGTLYARISVLGSDLIRTVLVPHLRNHTLPRMPQDHQRADYLRRRTEADGLIDWRQPAETIRNLVRGLTRPYCGAHTFRQGERLVVWSARAAAAPALPPGQVTATAAGIMAGTGSGPLLLDEVTAADGSPLRLRDGDRLG